MFSLAKSIPCPSYPAYPDQREAELTASLDLFHVPMWANAEFWQTTPARPYSQARDCEGLRMCSV